MSDTARKDSNLLPNTTNKSNEIPLAIINKTSDAVNTAFLGMKSKDIRKCICTGIKYIALCVLVLSYMKDKK